MNLTRLLSNCALRVLGMVMGLVGFVDGVIELHLSVHGFAPFACVLAVYYLHHSRSKKDILVRDKSDTYIYKRSTLMLFGAAVTELCLLEMATRSSVLGSIAWIAYTGVALFALTFSAASLCLFIVVNRFIRRVLSDW